MGKSTIEKACCFIHTMEIFTLLHIFGRYKSVQFISCCSTDTCKNLQLLVYWNEVFIGQHTLASRCLPCVWISGQYFKTISFTFGKCLLQKYQSLLESFQWAAQNFQNCLVNHKEVFFAQYKTELLTTAGTSLNSLATHIST